MDRSYLAHHGVKGQKWGIRRFQNKDGTRTPAGKFHRKKEFSEAELIERYSSDYDDFRKSSQYKVANDQAYSKTLEWYRKNEAPELESLIAKNNGSTKGLDAFHDFAKMYDGYADEYQTVAWHDYLEKAHPNYRDEIRSEKQNSKQTNPYGVGRAVTQEEYNRHARDAVRFGRRATNRILKGTMNGRSYRSVVAQEYAIKVGKTAAKTALTPVLSKMAIKALPKAVHVLALL